MRDGRIELLPRERVHAERVVDLDEPGVRPQQRAQRIDVLPAAGGRSVSDQRRVAPRGNGGEPLLEVRLARLSVRTIEGNPEIRGNRVLVGVRAQTRGEHLTVAVGDLTPGQLALARRARRGRQRVRDLEQGRPARGGHRTGELAARTGIQPEFRVANRHQDRGFGRAGGSLTANGRISAQRVVLLVRGGEAVEAAVAQQPIRGGQALRRTVASRGRLARRDAGRRRHRPARQEPDRYLPHRAALWSLKPSSEYFNRPRLPTAAAPAADDGPSTLG